MEGWCGSCINIYLAESSQIRVGVHLWVVPCIEVGITEHHQFRSFKHDVGQIIYSVFAVLVNAPYGDSLVGTRSSKKLLSCLWYGWDMITYLEP